MIQRMQTIWLLLAAVLAFAGLKFSVYSGNIMQELTQQSGLKIFQEINGMYHWGLNISTVATGVLALVSIFMFRNRKLQIRFCWITILLEIAVLLQYYFAVKKFAEGNISLTALIQPAILFALIMAISGIRKDEKIISESDRLR